MRRIGWWGGLLWMAAGCAMLGVRAIPPPGGCDRCHQAEISANWRAGVAAVTINDETGRNPWQRPEALLPPQTSPLEQQKITEDRCFRCHKGPDRAHVEYKGRYHHR